MADLNDLIKNEMPQAPRRHSNNTVLLWIFLSVVVLVGLGFLVIAPYMMNPSDKTVTVRIPKDATMDNVSDTLMKYYPEDYAKKVSRLLSIYGFDPVERHGLYEIPAGATPFATMRRLSRGGQTPVRLTINCFRDLPYLSKRMGLKMEFSGDEFYEAATDSAYLAQYGLTPEQALSLFLEDTYEVYWTATPKEVLDKIGANYISFWTQGKREDAEDLQLTPAEVMILASIVDEETNQNLEKGRIGRLYINRLQKGMKLQADPTVKYALKDQTIQRIYENQTKIDHPYNTYVIDGLPPGPLRTTSRNTVTEILTSQPSTDLFMCAREDLSGFHNFSSTYEEHLENAERYRKVLDEKGIK